MDLLLAGARILAGIHHGAIEGLSCSTCPDRVREELNCDLRDNDSSLYINEYLELDLATCPLKCVCGEALEYYDMYKYYLIFNAPPLAYKDMSYRFWEFIKEYDYWSNTIKIDSMKKENPSSKSTTDKNLSALKNQFMAKSKK